MHKWMTLEQGAENWTWREELTSVGLQLINNLHARKM